MTEFANFPWAAMVVFVGMAALISQLISVLNSALARSQMPVMLPPQPLPAPIKAFPPPPAAPPVPPPAADVPWLVKARAELGFRETGNNQGIGKYTKAAGFGSDGMAWCAIFLNAIFKMCGMPGTDSAMALSFSTSANFVRLNDYVPGCVVVFRRGTDGHGHVGIATDINSDHVKTLAGNQGDGVTEAWLAKHGSGLDLVGYFWPASYPMPGAAVTMTPVQIGTAPVIVDPGLIAAVKGFEGFSAKAYGDFKQYSIGYGTKANSADEVITEPEAEKRLMAELANAAALVEKFTPTAPVGVKQALTDLTYNVGPVWEGDALGASIKAGDYEGAKTHVLNYNHAGGKVLDGLTKRRATEVGWFDNPL